MNLKTLPVFSQGGQSTDPEAIKGYLQDVANTLATKQESLKGALKTGGIANTASNLIKLDQNKKDLQAVRTQFLTNDYLSRVSSGIDPIDAIKFQIGDQLKRNYSNPSNATKSYSDVFKGVELDNLISDKANQPIVVADVVLYDPQSEIWGEDSWKNFGEDWQKTRDIAQLKQVRIATEGLHKAQDKLNQGDSQGAAQTLQSTKEELITSLQKRFEFESEKITRENREAIEAFEGRWDRKLIKNISGFFNFDIPFTDNQLADIIPSSSNIPKALNTALGTVSGVARVAATPITGESVGKAFKTGFRENQPYKVQSFSDTIGDSFGEALALSGYFSQFVGPKYGIKTNPKSLEEFRKVIGKDAGWIKEAKYFLPIAGQVVMISDAVDSGKNILNASETEGYSGLDLLQDAMNVGFGFSAIDSISTGGKILKGTTKAGKIGESITGAPIRVVQAVGGGEKFLLKSIVNEVPVLNKAVASLLENPTFVGKSARAIAESFPFVSGLTTIFLADQYFDVSGKIDPDRSNSLSGIIQGVLTKKIASEWANGMYQVAIGNASNKELLRSVFNSNLNPYTSLGLENYAENFIDFGFTAIEAAVTGDIDTLKSEFFTVDGLFKNYILYGNGPFVKPSSGENLDHYLARFGKENPEALAEVEKLSREVAIDDRRIQDFILDGEFNFGLVNMQLSGRDVKEGKVSEKEIVKEVTEALAKPETSEADKAKAKAFLQVAEGVAKESVEEGVREAVVENPKLVESFTKKSREDEPDGMSETTNYTRQVPTEIRESLEKKRTLFTLVPIVTRAIAESLEMAGESEGNVSIRIDTTVGELNVTRNAGFPDKRLLEEYGAYDYSDNGFSRTTRNKVIAYLKGESVKLGVNEARFLDGIFTEFAKKARYKDGMRDMIRPVAVGVDIDELFREWQEAKAAVKEIEAIDPNIEPNYGEEAETATLEERNAPQATQALVDTGEIRVNVRTGERAQGSGKPIVRNSATSEPVKNLSGKFDRGEEISGEDLQFIGNRKFITESQNIAEAYNLVLKLDIKEAIADFQNVIFELARNPEKDLGKVFMDYGFTKSGPRILYREKAEGELSVVGNGWLNTIANPQKGSFGKALSLISLGLDANATASLYFWNSPLAPVKIGSYTHQEILRGISKVAEFDALYGKITKEKSKQIAELGYLQFGKNKITAPVYLASKGMGNILNTSKEVIVESEAELKEIEDEETVFRNHPKVVAKFDSLQELGIKTPSENDIKDLQAEINRKEGEVEKILKDEVQEDVTSEGESEFSKLQKAVRERNLEALVPYPDVYATVEDIINLDETLKAFKGKGSEYKNLKYKPVVQDAEKLFKDITDSVKSENVNEDDKKQILKISDIWKTKFKNSQGNIAFFSLMAEASSGFVSGLEKRRKQAVALLRARIDNGEDTGATLEGGKITFSREKALIDSKLENAGVVQDYIQDMVLNNDRTGIDSLLGVLNNIDEGDTVAQLATIEELLSLFRRTEKIINTSYYTNIFQFVSLYRTLKNFASILGVGSRRGPVRLSDSSRGKLDGLKTLVEKIPDGLLKAKRSKIIAKVKHNESILRRMMGDILDKTSGSILTIKNDRDILERAEALREKYLDTSVKVKKQEGLELVATVSQFLDDYYGTLTAGLPNDQKQRTDELFVELSRATREGLSEIYGVEIESPLGDYYAPRYDYKPSDTTIEAVNTVSESLSRLRFSSNRNIAYTDLSFFLAESFVDSHILPHSNASNSRADYHSSLAIIGVAESAAKATIEVDGKIKSKYTQAERNMFTEIADFQKSRAETTLKHLNLSANRGDLVGSGVAKLFFSFAIMSRVASFVLSNVYSYAGGIRVQMQRASSSRDSLFVAFLEGVASPILGLKWYNQMKEENPELWQLLEDMMDKERPTANPLERLQKASGILQNSNIQDFTGLSQAAFSVVKETALGMGTTPYSFISNSLTFAERGTNRFLMGLAYKAAMNEKEMRESKGLFFSDNDITSTVLIYLASANLPYGSMKLRTGMLGKFLSQTLLTVFNRSPLHNAVYTTETSLMNGFVSFGQNITARKGEIKAKDWEKNILDTLIVSGVFTISVWLSKMLLNLLKGVQERDYADPKKVMYQALADANFSYFSSQIQIAEQLLSSNSKSNVSKALEPYGATELTNAFNLAREGKDKESLKQLEAGLAKVMATVGTVAASGITRRLVEDRMSDGQSTSLMTRDQSILAKSQYIIFGSRQFEERTPDPSIFLVDSGEYTPREFGKLEIEGKEYDAPQQYVDLINGLSIGATEEDIQEIYDIKPKPITRLRKSSTKRRARTFKVKEVNFKTTVRKPKKVRLKTIKIDK